VADWCETYWLTASWEFYVMIGGSLSIIILCCFCCTLCISHHKKKKEQESKLGEQQLLASESKSLLSFVGGDEEEGIKSEEKPDTSPSFSMFSNSKKEEEAVTTPPPEAIQKDKVEALKKKREARRKKPKRHSTQLEKDVTIFASANPGMGRLHDNEEETAHIALVGEGPNANEDAEEEDMREILASIISILKDGLRIKFYKPQKNQKQDVMLKLMGYDIMYQKIKNRTGKCKKSRQIAIAELVQATVPPPEESTLPKESFPFQLTTQDERNLVFIATDEEQQTHLVQGFNYLINSHKNNTLDAFLSRTDLESTASKGHKMHLSLKRPSPVPKKY